MKCGSNPWLSVPYSPHLSPNYESQTFAKGWGLGVNVVKICSDNGEVCDISYIGLGTDFSNYLYCAANLIYERPFNLEEHRIDIATVYSKFPNDDDLAAACADEFKFVVPPSGSDE